MMYICTSIRHYSISKSVITYVPGTIQVYNLFDSMLYICMVHRSRYVTYSCFYFHRFHVKCPGYPCTMLQRRSVNAGGGAASDVSAAVSYLLGGSALNEACDILLAARSSSQSSPPQKEDSQKLPNEGEGADHHIQQLAALYQRGKAAYDIICRADEATVAISSEMMSFVTGGGNVATSTLLSASATQLAGPRSRGASLSKIAPVMLYRKKPSSDGGGTAGASVGSGGRKNRSLSDASTDAASLTHHNNPANGNNCRGKSATTNNSESTSEPPPEVLNFLKALNAGGGGGGSAAAACSATSTTTTNLSTDNNNDEGNTTSSKKREVTSPPLLHSASKVSNKRPPPHPPSRSSSQDEDDGNDDASNEETKATTPRRTRYNSRLASKTTAEDTRIYDIGESIFVEVDGKHYHAIVKNVDFQEEEEDGCGGGGGKEGGNADAMTKRAVYEVEFSDGEIWEGVGGNEIHSDEEE